MRNERKILVFVPSWMHRLLLGGAVPSSNYSSSVSLEFAAPPFTHEALHRHRCCRCCGFNRLRRQGVLRSVELDAEDDSPSTTTCGVRTTTPRVASARASTALTALPSRGHTSFNWNGTSWQVKSFANAALRFDPVQLADVKSIPSTIEYDYKYDGKIITNVAYDLFTSATANGTVEYELMNGNTTSSLRRSQHDEQLSADFKQFFDELPEDNTIASTQYLTHMQAGTEPSQGQNATLTVSKYSAAVNAA
ncbi:Inactive glycoside hydrolase XLP1 [Phytophthora ramorum]|uniref:Inactive glycoside hydrolase XLP1 n=1 Tax=Phytophthora ramorum TaxID=164328 RepID=UPI00309A29D3|nr:Inactive glycoside hydrolase XLP1 [Phytophthora ramorum]